MQIYVKIKRQVNSTSQPYWQTFLYEGKGKLTVADLLAELNMREKLLDIEHKPASPIIYETSCHEKKCGACAMLINGIPRLACSVFLTHALTKHNTLTLEPLSKFPVIRDLQVDRKSTFTALKKMQLWLSSKNPDDHDWDRELQYQAGQCLECGCCLEICPNYYPGSSFAGNAAMVQAYKILEQNTNDEHVLELKEQYYQHFYKGCSQSLSCKTICPANLPIDEMQSRANHKLWQWRKK